MSEQQQRHCVFARSRARLMTKLVSMLNAGPSKLKIITDFDATLSKPNGPSSWGVVETNPDFTQSYRDHTRALFAKYHPFEISPTLSHEEKCEAMVAWWGEAQKALRSQRVSRQRYEQLLSYAQEAVKLRDGCDVLFYLSSKLQIPCLIFSAGIGDVIDAVMLHHFSHYYHPSNPYYPMQRLPTAFVKAHQRSTLEASSSSSSCAVSALAPVGEAAGAPSVSSASVNLTSPSPPLVFTPSVANTAMSPVTQADVVAHNPGVVPGIPKTIFIIANHFEFQSAGCGDGSIEQNDAPTDSDDTTTTTTTKRNTINTVKRFDPFTHRPDDVMCGFYEDEGIHVFNKHEALVRDKADYYPTLIQPRTHALLIGDSLGDALMVASDSTDNVVRVGFLNTSANKTVDSHLQAYLAKFDIVFVDCDHGVAFCNTVMRYFTAPSQEDEVEEEVSATGDGNVKDGEVSSHAKENHTNKTEKLSPQEYINRYLLGDDVQERD